LLVDLFLEAHARPPRQIILDLDATEATCNDRALIGFLQRWCGYCLTGDTSEHALVFCYGPGGNGKCMAPAHQPSNAAHPLRNPLVG